MCISDLVEPSECYVPSLPMKRKASVGLLVYANNDLHELPCDLACIAFGQYEGKCGGQLQPDIFICKSITGTQTQGNS
jgi:hypothetical protein